MLPHRVTALGCTVPQKTPGEQTTHRSPSLTERGPAWLRRGAQFLQLTAGVPVPRLPFAPSDLRLLDVFQPYCPLYKMKVMMFSISKLAMSLRDQVCKTLSREAGENDK